MLRAVNIAWRSSRTLDSVRAWVSGSLVDTLGRAGYRVQSETATVSAGGPAGTEWILLKETRSAYWLMFSWVAWLWVKDRHWVVMSLTRLGDGRSELIVAGDVPGRLAVLLKELAAPAQP